MKEAGPSQLSFCLPSRIKTCKPSKLHSARLAAESAPPQQHPCGFLSAYSKHLRFMTLGLFSRSEPWCDLGRQSLVTPCLPATLNSTPSRHRKAVCLIAAPRLERETMMVIEKGPEAKPGSVSQLGAIRFLREEMPCSLWHGPWSDDRERRLEAQSDSLLCPGAARLTAPKSAAQRRAAVRSGAQRS